MYQIENTPCSDSRWIAEGTGGASCQGLEEPEEFPVGDMGMASSFLLLLGRHAVVTLHQAAPDQDRHQAERERSGEAPGPVRPEDHRNQCRDGHVAVADVEHVVVVDLGRAEDGTGRVELALPLAVGHEGCHDERDDQHDHMPGSALVPVRPVGDASGQRDQQRDGQPQEQVPGEERRELLGWQQRNEAAFQHQSDEQVPDGRQCVAAQQSSEEPRAYDPAEAVQ